VSQPEKEYLDRKERAVMEDLKTAFTGYDRLVRQISEIRRWTVTVEVAAIGLVMSKQISSMAVFTVPATLALLAFMLLELRERSSMRFNKKEVLAIENIY